MLASTTPLSSPTCSASPALPPTGLVSENEPAPARTSPTSLPDMGLRCPAGTPLRDNTALFVPESSVYRSSFGLRNYEWGMFSNTITGRYRP
jgi:hypothetical protein